MPRVGRKKPGVHARLLQRRLEVGLTQRELAIAAGSTMTAAYISRLEHGARDPSLEVLIDLAGPLQTTALYLLTGTHNMSCPCCGSTPSHLVTMLDEFTRVR